MSATEIRQKYLPEFRDLARPGRLIAFATLAALGLQTIAAMALGSVALAELTGLPKLLALAASVIFIATRFRAFNNIVHECSHNSFSATRADNRIIGAIAASLTLGCFRKYRDEHLSHHAHLGDYEHDKDLQGIEGLRLHDPLTPRVFARHLLTPLVGRHLPYYLSIDLSAEDGRIYQVLKAVLLAAAALSLFLAPVFTLLLVILPFAWVFTALNYWADCLDHAGLIGEKDELRASRNMLAPWLLRWLFFPRNDCYHLVHHLFPLVPAGHLHHCHRRLMEDRQYATSPNAAPRAHLRQREPVRREPVEPRTC